MVFVFLGLAGIAGTIFSIAFIVWIVALIINKKDLIKRAWKFTWISFAVTLVCSLGYGFTLWGVFDSSNDTEQVSQSDTKEDKEDEKYAEQQENKREQEEAVYTKNAPVKVTFDKDDYDGAGVLTKYNMRNGYKYNYYKDSNGDYFYYSINDKHSFPPDRRYLYQELATVKTNEKYAKTHKKDIELLSYGDAFPPSYDLSKLKDTGVYTINPPKRDKMRGGILSDNFNRQKGYQVNYYYGDFKTPDNIEDPISNKDKNTNGGYYYYNGDGQAITIEGDSVTITENKLKENPDKLLQQ